MHLSFKIFLLLAATFLASPLVTAQEKFQDELKERDRSPHEKEEISADTYASHTAKAKSTAVVEDAEESEEDLDARDRYRSMMRANEKGQIPFEAVMHARRAVEERTKPRQVRDKAAKAEPLLSAPTTPWESLGPGNVGGRIRAIVINPNAPNVMYVGGVSGGVWKSDNGGSSWYPLNDFMASLDVTTLAMDPTNAVVLYAGTGEEFSGSTGPSPNFSAPPGAGVFKSTDAGLTWTQLPSTVSAQWGFVNRLSHHPTSSNILLAATGSGVFRTVNGGTSWANVLSGVDAYQVKFHPTDGTKALCGTSTGFYLSTDGGVTWTQQTTGAANKLPSPIQRCEGDFAKTDSSIYVNVNLNNGEVWRSTDGGTTWTQRSTGVGYFGGGAGQGQYDNAIWVDPTNSSLIVLSGRNLQRSADGGATLTKIGGDVSGAIKPYVHPDIHSIVSHPQYNGTTNKTVFIGCDGGIYGTTDITTASLSSGWQYLNSSLGTTQFYSGAVASDGSLVAGGAQDNDRLHYVPPGGMESWAVATAGSAAGGDGTTTVIDFTNAQRVYALTASGLNIGRSDDGGTTFNTKTTGISDTGLWVSPLVMDPNNANALVAGGTKIWKTTNNADNWTLIRNTIATTPTCSVIDIAKGNSNIIWVGYSNGQLSRTTDGGTNWSNLPGTGLPTTAVTSISISAINNSVVAVSFGGYSANNVWVTQDGGTTWFQRTGSAPYNLPSIQVNTIRFHPLSADWIYAGTDFGAFASYDRGITWYPLPSDGQGAGPANVEVSQLFWQGTQYLYAATFGRGIFRRSAVDLGPFVNVGNPNPGDGTLAHNYYDRHLPGVPGDIRKAGASPALERTGYYSMMIGQVFRHVQSE
jgi:photosystem II stability/assembly factor-like uncharacterized protein